MSETHPKLGQLIEGDQNRDAIHIAVAPVVAGERLDPGEHVCLTPSGFAVLAQGKSIGVVDPFLRAFVGKGDKFWLFLTPGSVTGLRHEWSHPAFSVVVPDTAKAESERWLRAFADEWAVDYLEMVSGVKNGSDVCFGRGSGPDNVDDEFWHHIEVVTGRSYSTLHRDNTEFRCSC
jgi:hypothetical protein